MLRSGFTTDCSILTLICYRLKNMETESREELVRFLYQYVMIGIRYHSSMLSRLTDAFALVKRCETVVSQSSFDVSILLVIFLSSGHEKATKSL